MTDFSDLGLAAPLLKALAAQGYDSPTPIQVQAIPIVLEGHDLIGLAQTGTGKTAAFSLPMLQRLAGADRRAAPGRCRALVLAPTRELAAQIGENIRAYGRFLGISSTVVFGGAPLGRQRQQLQRGVDILIATPGRLLDHLSQGVLRLDDVEVLVLDEADHMLDLGFIHDLKRIARLLPKSRQSLFFSATMPKAIADLAGQFLRDPRQVAVTPVSSTAERVSQSVIHIAQARKADVLVDLLGDRAVSRALVFTRTKRGADRLAKKLDSVGIAAEAIHGNKSQGQRTRALDGFRGGKTRLLIATEIAARGIDVDDVSHVFNFDLPHVAEQYVHRIGRTARAGNGGIAISLCDPEERPYLRDIEKLIKQPLAVIESDYGLTAPAETQARGAERRPQPEQRSDNARQGEPRRHKPRPQKSGQRHAGKPGGRSAPAASPRSAGDGDSAGLDRFIKRPPATGKAAQPKPQQSRRRRHRKGGSAARAT